MVICHPGVIKPHDHFKASIYVLKKEEGGRHTPFHNHYRPQFYIRTLDVTGEIMLPAGVEMVMPGDNVEIDVKLIRRFGSDHWHHRGLIPLGNSRQPPDAAMAQGKRIKGLAACQSDLF